MENEQKTNGMVTNEAALAVMSALVERSMLANRAGLSYGGKRDIYEALGYPRKLTFKHFYDVYKRQDIAKRLIQIEPNVSWRFEPYVIETDSDNVDTQFEKKWKEIATKNKVFYYLHKADVLSRIGSFGVVFLGFRDVAPLEQEVTRAADLLYINCFHEGAVDIKKYVDDPQSPRHGLPELYEITLESGTGQTRKRLVHHSRILHIAENCLEGDIFGEPVLEAVFNRLINLELIAGGSAEMFWRGGFPGIGFESQDGAKIEDPESLQKMIEEYMHGLKRYYATEGVTGKVLPVQVANPQNHFAMQIDLISATRGIPKRILLGSERGELASQQDERAFLSMVEDRRTTYVEPRVLRPFIDRLVEVGLLPEPGEGYGVQWPPLLVMGEKEKADIAQVRATTLATYSNSAGADMIIPPKIFLEELMGFDRDTVDRIEDELHGEFKRDSEGEDGV